MNEFKKTVPSTRVIQ